MANILYGVNGEGAGHSTRAKEVLTHLRKQGHTLHVASFDRGMRNLSDQFEVTEVFGFRLAYVNNRWIRCVYTPASFNLRRTYGFMREVALRIASALFLLDDDRQSDWPTDPGHPTPHRHAIRYPSSGRSAAIAQLQR